jgi:serine protease AprX
LAANPTSLNIQAGTHGNSTITISPLTGFKGVVSLTTTVSPSGLNCAISPASITLGVAQSSSLSCYGPAGNYTVVVTASSGTVVHSITVLYQIVDFSLIAPGSITCVQGAKSCSYTITISSVNGFTGTVSLTIIGQPSGAAVTVSPTSVSLSSGGTATVTVKITPPSSGSVTVQGSSGSLVHSVSTHLILAT